MGEQLAPVTLQAAPMAGISDWIFRLLCYEQGCDIAYTEMVNALGYLCAPKDNRANKEVLTLHPDEKKTIVQIFGKEPKEMGIAAKQLVDTYGYDEVNINMGCPAKKIAGKGEGAALMTSPSLAQKIIEQVVANTPGAVSVKMRLGWNDDEKNVLSFAKMAQDCGVKKIIIHGRTKEQGYSGKADWGAIGQVKEALNVPVIANGDIKDWPTAREVIQTTKADGLMIGRGALGNPWVFSEIAAALQNKPWQPPTMADKIATALRHTRLMINWKEEKYGIVEMRKHIAWYLSGLRGSSAIRAKVNTVHTFCQVEDILLQYLSEENDYKSDEIGDIK